MYILDSVAKWLAGWPSRAMRHDIGIVAMNKIYLVGALGLSFAVMACSPSLRMQKEETFQSKTGVVGVFRQSAFYCSEATPHFIQLGDSLVEVKPTWSNEQDNSFFANLKPGTATLYSYSYNCGDSENKFTLDTTEANVGPSGVIVPESGLCKIVISFVQGEKLFTRNDDLIREQFEKDKAALNASNIPFCEVVKTDGSKVSFANKDSLMHEQYLAAVESAKSGSCEDIRPLITIDSTSDKVTWNLDKNRVLMIAAHSTPELYEADRSLTVESEIRVFSDKEFLQWYKTNRKGVRNWPLRLRQLLGLPREENLTHFTAFWVETKDLVRPAYVSDITSTEMKCRFDETEDESQLDAAGMWLRNWFDTKWDASYKSKVTYPWTRLGYTYDWGSKGDRYGLSEFLIMNEAKVTIQSTRDVKSFVKWLSDRD